MVIKIFYVAVALFSVAMVILTVQTPYNAQIFIKDTKIADMIMDGVVDYELNSTQVSKVFNAQRVIRYSDKDEFEFFRGLILGKDFNSTLASNKAFNKEPNLIFEGDAVYTNTDGLKYVSEQILYNMQTKILKSDLPFVMTQHTDRVVGKSVVYDMNTKQINAKEIRAWIEQKR